RPGIVEWALRKVRLHRLVGRELGRQSEAVRLVIEVHRRARTITSVRARRQRDSLAIRAAARVQTDDALKRHVEQISVRPLGTDRVEHAIGELHHLLLGIREHRNVRVTHRAANRHPLAIDPAPSVEARLTLRVKLGESDPAAKLSLSRALAPRKPHTTVTTAPLKLVTLRIDLVSLPNRRALLVIQHSRLTLEG